MTHYATLVPCDATPVCVLPSNQPAEAAMDYGHFKLVSPDEATILQNLTERAAENTVRPGHAWLRVVTDMREPGHAPQSGVLEYHLDGHRRVLEVREMWGGRETARRTRSMDEGGEN